MKKPFFHLLALAFLFGCAPGPNVDILAPVEGRPGDVIDIRDPVSMTLGTGGTVSFGPVQDPVIRKWTESDIYVEVPGGISGTVMVGITRDLRVSPPQAFLVLEEDTFPRVMAFGDSVTYWGCGWIESAMEEDPYLSQFHPLHINQGKRGEKVTGTETPGRWQDALTYCDCDVAVLMHGINDLTDPLFPEEGIPLEEIQQGMISMIDAAAATGRTLILCTLPPRVAPCGDEASPTTEEYNAWLRSYAGQHGLALVDVYEAFVSTPGWDYLLFGNRCLHPGAEGHMKIAELVNEKVVEILLPTCTDSDGDGYGDPAAPPCPYPERDCDDTDPDIHPGVVEAPHGEPICSDGLDNDCDGLADTEDDGCQECLFPEECDDGNVCTDDDCVDHACTHTYNTEPCDDGDPCTMEDVCSNGACGGVPLDGDGDLFISDACGGSDCDDSNPEVHPGVIEGPFGDPVCLDDLDNDCDGDVDGADSGCYECAVPEDCDDGLWCNGSEVCTDHLCQAGTPPDCSDGISCTEDTCNETDDVCENTPDHGLCDDANPCTNDACDALTDCRNDCNASGPEDPCCLDPACSGAPACEAA